MHKYFRDLDQFDDLSEVLTSGMYQNIKLKGRTPSLAYKDAIIDGLLEALETRFTRHSSEALLNSATKILHFDKWPQMDSHDIRGLGMQI